jgi:hypothetical protein
MIKKELTLIENIVVIIIIVPQVVVMEEVLIVMKIFCTILFAMTIHQ